MALIGLGMQRILVIPVEPLRRGGMTIAPGTAEALGPDANVDDAPEDGQMAQEAWLVLAMPLGNGSATRAKEVYGKTA